MLKYSGPVLETQTKILSSSNLTLTYLQRISIISNNLEFSIEQTSKLNLLKFTLLHYYVCSKNLISNKRTFVMYNFLLYTLILVLQKKYIVLQTAVRLLMKTMFKLGLTWKLLSFGVSFTVQRQFQQAFSEKAIHIPIQLWHLWITRSRREKYYQRFNNDTISQQLLTAL